MRILFNEDGHRRPEAGVRAILRSLHRSEETGILQLREPAHPHVDVYLQDGALVSCTSDLDEERVLQQAMELVGWDRRRMDKLREGDRALPLLQLLQERDLLEEAQLQAIAERCIRDNLKLALGTRWREAAFEHEDAVFPPCVILDLQTDEWLDGEGGESPGSPAPQKAATSEYHLDHRSLHDTSSRDDDDPSGPGR